jgi:hypothetical protein
MAFLPMYKGSAEIKDKDIDENLIDCEGLLLVFGGAPPDWVRAQLRRYAKIEWRRKTTLRCKKLLLAPGAQPEQLGDATTFDRIDYSSGATADRIRQLVGELCLS